ncbi:hypothetical protein [Stieleria marina]|uniref:Uncharacterized protein n=1 Tax=Stieleria marina TaxID=1930275 RepID=A0A517NSE4_9BACT|nr:hypothetical protein K239x_19780 [Planctomycetes bacterium K23_9]
MNADPQRSNQNGLDVFSTPNASSSDLSLPLAESSAASPCCGGFTKLHFVASALAVTTLIALGAATYFAGQASVAKTSTASESKLAAAAMQLEGFQLPSIDASAALSSDKFSMATGSVGESGEGLFVLDHNSGLLQCAVMYPRLAQFMALYTVNVSEALATGGKGGKYIMATGALDFPTTSARPAAPLVVYVLDTSTGNYACYGVPFNRAAVNSGKPQQGMMILLGTGTANPIADRDSGR